MKFSFAVNLFTPQTPGSTTYKVLTLEAEAPTVEEAYEQIKPQIPEGHRMWCWWSNEKVSDEADSP